MTIEPPLSVNTADADNLSVRAGLDANTARELVKYREANGPFRSWEEMREVPGLSQAMIDHLMDIAVLEPEDATPR